MPVLAIVVVATLYWLTGQLALLLALPPSFVTSIWPPAGIALVAVLMVGNRVSVGVLLGAMAVHVGHIWDPSSAATIARCLAIGGVVGTGAMLQALVGASLIRRYVGFPTPLDTADSVLAFLSLGGPLSCTLSALVGSTTLLLSRQISLGDYPGTVWNWWAGDMLGVIIVAPLCLIAFARPRDMWRRRRWTVAAPLLALCVFFVVLSERTQNWNNDTLDHRFEEQSEPLVREVESSISRHVEAVLAIQSHVHAVGVPSREQFRVLVNRSLDRLDGLLALEWIPRVEAGERQPLVARMRSEGHSDFEINERDAIGNVVRAGDVPPWFPVALVEPFERNRSAHGFNVASNPARLEALHRARDTGQIVASGGVELVQDGARGLGVLILAPVYSTASVPSTVPDRRAALLGFALAVVELESLVPEHLAHASGDLVVTLLDESASGSDRTLVTAGSTAGASLAEELGLGVRRRIRFGRRGWMLDMRPTDSWVAEERGWEVAAVLPLGLLLTGLIGAFLLLMTGRTMRIEALVAERTRDLAAANSSLEAALGRIGAILDTVADGIVTVGADGVVQTVNPAACRLFGREVGELRGLPLEVLVPEHAPLSELARRASDDEPEAVGVRKDGSTFDVELSVGALVVDSRRLYVTVLRDISERKQVDRLKDEFVSTVSHELRTPLTSIYGAMRLMQGGAVGELLPKAQRLVGVAVSNAERLTRLINDILDLEKIEAGKLELELEVVEPSVLIDAAVEGIQPMATAAGVTVRGEDSACSPLQVDSDRVLQVLDNLLSNAIKFSPRGAEVVLRAAVLDSGRTRVSVEDHGVGISAEDMPRLFQKFQQLDASDTRRVGGTGLGLAISRAIVEQHGGVIGVHSVPGEGSTFWFELPTTSATIDQEEVSPS